MIDFFGKRAKAENIYLREKIANLKHDKFMFKQAVDFYKSQVPYINLEGEKVVVVLRDRTTCNNPNRVQSDFISSVILDVPKIVAETPIYKDTISDLKENPEMRKALATRIVSNCTMEMDELLGKMFDSVEVEK